MAWHHSLTFDPQETFCTCVVFPLPQKGGSGDPLILHSNTVLPLFVPDLTITLTIPVTITLRCLQEAKTTY